MIDPSKSKYKTVRESSHMTQLSSFDSNSSFFCCPYYSRLADSPNIVYTH
jgi:hypothetical protein